MSKVKIASINSNLNIHDKNNIYIEIITNDGMHIERDTKLNENNEIMLEANIKFRLRIETTYSKEFLYTQYQVLNFSSEKDYIIVPKINKKINKTSNYSVNSQLLRILLAFAPLILIVQLLLWGIVSFIITFFFLTVLVLVSYFIAINELIIYIVETEGKCIEFKIIEQKIKSN